jgi:hypothetical protein
MTKMVGFAAALAGTGISLFRLHPAPEVALHLADEMLDVVGPLFMYLALGLTPGADRSFSALRWSRSMGSSIESWPHWANDAPGSHYLTK